MDRSGIGNIPALARVAVAAATTHTFDANLACGWEAPVTAAITTFSIVNAKKGQLYTIAFIQDGTGHAIAQPGAFKNCMVWSTAAGKTSTQSFELADDGTTFRGIGSGMIY